MVNKISYVVTDNTVPYENLALEEFLLYAAEPQECILYLWQNRRTVVIGRNQNCRVECRMAELLQDGGYLVRRLSGGGAVFHDLGNLNFTFLVRSEDYSLDRQLEVILRAVRSLGIAAEKSGRNDIIADGRKFSGNAFYTSGDCKYHHGTLMVDADLENLSRYLTVSPDKLSAKGVKSVRSRVVNLHELNPDITIERVKAALITSFGEVYGLQPAPMDALRIDSTELARRAQRFASYDWRIGSEPDFTTALSGRFAWGGIELQLSVSCGMISSATVYTDAMDARLAPALSEILTGTDFSAEGIAAALASRLGQSRELIEMAADVARMMEDWQNG